MPRRNGFGASWRRRSKSWPRQNPRSNGGARPQAPRRNGCGASWGARRKSWPRQNPRSNGGARRTSADAERLRGELGRTQKELAAAKSEVERFSTTNATLTEQVNSLRADSQSAMEVARRNLVVMEERIEQLNTALAGAGLGAIAPASEPQASPVAKPDEAVVADRTPSAQSEAAEKGGAAPGADNEVAAVAAGHGKLAE